MSDWWIRNPKRTGVCLEGKNRLCQEILNNNYTLVAVLSKKKIRKVWNEKNETWFLYQKDNSTEHVNPLSSLNYYGSYNGETMSRTI